jgi:hypothetical protein
MLCGIGRLSPRSLLATAIFFPTAVATFHLTNPALVTAACSSAEVACYEPAWPEAKTAGATIGLLVLVAGLIVFTQQRGQVSSSSTRSGSSPSMLSEGRRTTQESNRPTALQVSPSVSDS